MPPTNHVFAPLTPGPQRIGGSRAHSADDGGRGRNARQRPPFRVGPAGRGRARPADRLRESRQPAARARGNTSARVCGAHGARREPVAHAAQFVAEGLVLSRGGRRARDLAGAGGRPGDPAFLSRQPAANEGSVSRPERAAFHGRHRHGHRAPVWHGAAGARQREGPRRSAERRRARRHRSGAAARAARAGGRRSRAGRGARRRRGAARSDGSQPDARGRWVRSIRLVTFSLTLPQVNYPRPADRQELSTTACSRGCAKRQASRLRARCRASRPIGR